METAGLGPPGRCPAPLAGSSGAAARMGLKICRAIGYQGAMTIADTTILSLADTARLQPLGTGEGAVILRLSDGQLYSCNDTVVSFVEAMDGTRNFGQLVNSVLAEYEVERAELHADLQAIAGELIAEGVICAQPE